MANACPLEEGSSDINGAECPLMQSQRGLARYFRGSTSENRVQKSCISWKPFAHRRAFVEGTPLMTLGIIIQRTDIHH